MDFRLLGPLEVWHEGREVPLRGAKQRALLAVLLLHANQVVSSDRLLDELWGDEPLEARTAALRVRLSQLRKALGAGGGSLIVTRAPGYAIELTPDQLDLQRFERLVQEAGTLEPEAAAEKLRDALALWRGPALADFAYEPFAQTAIGRLGELRLLATEKRIDADLALGRHAELVPELEELIAEHTLQEHLRAQLMLALYRAGRQAEALESYQSARRTLVDELGIEPGPALQKLEKAILRQDPELELQPSEPVIEQRPARSPAGEAATERSILVVPTAVEKLDALLAIAEPLTRRPRREIIVAALVHANDELEIAATLLDERRAALTAASVTARAAAFTTDAWGSDVVRLASEQNVDLLVVDSPSA